METISERKGLIETSMADAITSDTKKIIHVMIVDDTPFNLIVLEKFLHEINDYRVIITKAYNGKEAIELSLSAEPPIYLLYMDCNMPIMDGYEATLILKKNMNQGKIKKAPVLAVTALSGKDNEKKCYDSKMDDFLPKPIIRQKFYECFRKWVKS